MKFFESGEDVSDVERGVRNSWKWYWLDEECDQGMKFRLWCKKIEEAGKCFCSACHKVINYGSSGKKALKIHANHADHISRIKSVEMSSKLVSDTANSKLCLQDASAEIKARASLFAAQHCLPFSVIPHLLEFAKSVNTAPNALQQSSLSRFSATYITTHGVAEDIKMSLKEQLKDRFFSLNVDEATTTAGHKFMNVLVQYFDENAGKCLVDLLGCREVDMANAANLFSALESLMAERGLDWHRTISVLMDNCAVMRGTKEGLETKIRQQNPFLLNVSGDTVHMANNAAKKLFSYVEKDFVPVTSIASDIHMDIENSPKANFLFSKVQKILKGKSLSVIRPVPTRFLQMKTVCDRLMELWDPLTIYYSAFLEENDPKVKIDIYDKFHISLEDRKTMDEILIAQKKQAKSDANYERKVRIINALIDKSVKSQVAIQLYRGVLDQFQSFVKLFQSNKPMCHTLHTELFKLVQQYFSNFILPEHIPQFDAGKLANIKYNNEDIHVKDRHVFVGEFCLPLIMKCQRDKSSFPWVTSFYKTLKAGYVEAAKMILKLPLNNTTLTKLCYLDPCNQRSSMAVQAFLSLGQSLPNVIKEEELGILDKEARCYTIDDDISMIDADSTDGDFRLDEDWWQHIFLLKSQGKPKYPLLSKLVKALLSIISGPLIEGTFNIMDDIIEDDRSRLTPFNYEALAMTKSFMHTRKIDSTKFKVTPRMIKNVQNSYSFYKAHSQKEASVSTFPSAVICNKSIQSKGSSTLCETQNVEKGIFTTNATQSSKPLPQEKRKQTSLAGFFSKKPRLL